MYWHGRPLEDVHAEVNRVLGLPAHVTNRPAVKPPQVVRPCADDSAAPVRQVPLPGTVSVTTYVVPSVPRFRH